jgi:hypothetical protein
MFDPISLGIGAAISIGSSIVGWLMDNGRRDEAERILQRAQAEYGSVTGPVLEKIAFQELGPSAFDQIRSDPTFKQAQYDALEKLKQVSDSGGMTLQDQAAQNKANYAAQRAGNAGYSRIRQDMNRLGTLGSGADMALRAAQAQDSAQRYSEIGQETAGNAQRRAFEAIMARGQMGGQMRSQDFSEQSTIAQARDRIAQYNNDLINRGKMFNQFTLPQQQYQNRVSDAGRRYGMAVNQANMQLGRGQNDRQTWAGLGHAIGGTVAGIGNQGGFPWQQQPDYQGFDSAPTPFEEDLQDFNNPYDPYKRGQR